MECLLCAMWQRMPYSKRYTTPPPVAETEGALVVGYWLASRQEGVARLCERHMNIVGILDQQEELRSETEKAAQAQLAERQLQASPNVIQVIAANMQPIVQPTVPSNPQGFQLGPGPLTNENYVTPPPPLPVCVPDPSAVYRAPPGTVEGALEAAKMPDTPGAKVEYQCPLCGKEVATGDVHAC